MQSIAVLNRKGGVGKSTVAVNVAAVLAETDSCYLLDSDDQRSSARWVCDADPDKWGYLRVWSPADRLPRPQDLSRPDVQRATFAVLDSPPGDPNVVLEAFAHCSMVVVPIGPSPLDFHAAQSILTQLSARQIPALAVLTLTTPGTSIRKLIRNSLTKSNIPLAEVELVRRVAHVEAAISLLPITRYAPGSPGDLEVRQLVTEVRGILAKSRKVTA